MCRLLCRRDIPPAGEEVLNLGFGAGMGLPNMKRSSDEMHIDTSIGVGTTVTMTIYIRTI